MTVEQIIQLALWVPFGLIVLISGLIFCISGYKKGLWRALIALGATITAAVISLLLARLLSGVIAPVLSQMLPLSELADSGLPAGLVTELMGGLIKMAVSLVLFPVFMFIFTIVLRIVSYHIREDKLRPTKKFMRWLGTVTGLVSAFVYTLLLLLPLYGTLGVYMPTVETLLSMTGKGGETGVYLQSVTAHPVVKLSGSGPVSGIYGSLSAVDVGDTSLNVAQMAQTAEDAMNALEAVAKADDTDRMAKVQELMRILRHEVVEQKWFYEVMQEGITEIRKEIPVEEDPEAAAYVMAMLDVLDCSQKDFGENCAAILDFGTYCLNHGILDILEGENIEGFYESGIMAEAGKLANCSDEAVQVKRLMMSVLLTPVLEKNQQEMSAWMDAHNVGQTTDPKEQEKEAEALLMMMTMGGDSQAESIMRHPDLGEPALREMIAEKGFAQTMGVEDEDLIDRINASTTMQTQLMTKLTECAQKPIGQQLFSEYVRALCRTKDWLQDSQNDFHCTDADAMLFAVRVLGQEAFEKSDLKAGKETFVFARTMLEQILLNGQYNAATDNFNYMRIIAKTADLLGAAKSKKLPTSMDKYQNGQLDLVGPLQLYLGTEQGFQAIRYLVETKGNDPLNLSGKISSKQATVLKTLIQQICKSNEQIPDIEERESYVNRFFGLK